MVTPKLKKLWVLACLCHAFVVVSSDENSSTRLSKHFSLFSVVQFNNEQCTTDTTPAGGATIGTCYTASECTTKNGVSAGRCASGFGVCCVFLNIGEANAQIMENRTRLRNRLYPLTNAATAAQSISYTVNKMQSDICQIRLDFSTFVLAGPANTLENIGGTVAQTTHTHCTTDTLTIVTSAISNVVDTPSSTLCGALTGEHLYVELSPTAADTATVQIATNPATTNAATADRVWDVMVSQIECHVPWRAPAGCDRFITTDAGQITSYNFRTLANSQGSNTGIELAAQSIKTCIRRSKGMCCVEYQVCTAFGGIVLVDAGTNGATIDRGVGSITNQLFINPAWSLDTNTWPFRVDTAIASQALVASSGAVIIAVNSQINIGMVDSQCSGDYVEIPSSWSGGCGSSHGSARNSINSRYCGARFGANFQSARAGAAGQQSRSSPVCDCSEPFVVRHNSDTVNDVGGTGDPGDPLFTATLVGAAAVTGDQAVATNNIGGTTGATPRGFCLDFKQLPCWH